MERKASKCIEIAESRLGRTASQDEIEDLALRYMDLPSRQINAKLQRIAGTQYKRNDARSDVHKKNKRRRDEALKKNKNKSKERMSEEEFGEIMASDFLADDVMQEGTGYDGDDVGPGNHVADFMADDEMAEEIAMLKAANARLASQMRRMAEDVVQQETGYEGDDESVDTLDEEEGEGPTKKLASEMMAEDMAILAEMMQEASEMGDADRMAEIMAEMNIIADYKKHNDYGEAAPGFGYQDPDTRGKNRRDRKSEWDGRTKDFHNLNYYMANRKKIWGVDYDGPVGKYEKYKDSKKTKKADLMAEDILSDEEFAEIMSEMDRMAIVDRKLGKGYYKKHNDYGEAAPGLATKTQILALRIEEKVSLSGMVGLKTSTTPTITQRTVKIGKKIYAPELRREETRRSLRKLISTRCV